jgi:hypothetical protein
MQTRPILLISRHPLWSPKNSHTSIFGTAQERSFALSKALVRVLSFTASSRMRQTFWITLIGLDTTRNINPAVIDFSLCAFEGTLDARDEIKVTVERGFSG